MSTWGKLYHSYDGEKNSDYCKYLCNCETIFENNLTQGEISLTIGEESHLGMACQTCQTSSQTGSQTSSQTCLSCLYNTEQEKLNI